MKRILCVLLSLIMVLSVAAGIAPCVFADTSGVIVSPADPVQEVTDLQDLAPDASDPFAGYVDKAFGTAEPTRNVSSGAANLSSANDKKVYNALAAMITQVAAGQRSSTSFELTLAAFGITKDKFTAEDLGVSSLLNGNSISSEAVSAMRGMVDFSFPLVVRELMYSMPYELYWFDKTAGYSSGSVDIWYASSSEYPNGYLYFDPDLNYVRTVSMSVASAYALDGQQLVFDTSIGLSVQSSAANARAIVNTYASLDDYEKVVAYKNKICDLVSYNHDAASNSSTPYGDPWQLIWVFDGDTSTNVVCEGYSKAFQYLCQLSTFKSTKVGCVSVSGIMSGGTGSGGHMWNILSMDDGINYLVDVTNCDSGTIGNPDLLFLKGASGNVDDGYTITCYGTGISYTYDSFMYSIFDRETLTVSAADYVKQPQIDFRRSLALENQIAVNALIGRLPEGTSASEYTVKVSFNGSFMELADGTTEMPLTGLPKYTLTFDGIQSEYYYLVLASLAAKEMTNDYTVIVYRNGTEAARDIYSIRQYCLSAIASPTISDKGKLLARAVATYGAEAQTYFGYHTDNMADEGIERVSLTAIPAEYAPAEEPAQIGITKVNMSLSLEFQTFLNVTFTPETAGVRYEASVKKDGAAYTDFEVLRFDSGATVVRIFGTPAKQLGTQYEITLTNTSTGASATWSRSIMNYCYKAQSVSSMTNVIRALYQYYQAAK